MTTYIRWFRDIGLADVGLVGGKTASLGELFGQLGAAGVRVPDGFAVTAEAYRALLDAGVSPPEHKPVPAETKSVPEKPSK